MERFNDVNPFSPLRLNAGAKKSMMNNGIENKNIINLKIFENMKQYITYILYIN